MDVVSSCKKILNMAEDKIKHYVKVLGGVCGKGRILKRDQKKQVSSNVSEQ